ncbi:helix-turn-helix domain-containing protein [Bengtsoniella intestinalis]|uniref:helix-turn-helix domain-containing protein n=1 Tax=Bengtsoniella intestinalis TaxID=3073143 RepID=UPI00391F6ECE
MEHPLLTVKETASILRISTSKVYQLINEDAIPHIKLGNRCIIPRQALMDWIGLCITGGKHA